MFIEKQANIYPNSTYKPTTICCFTPESTGR